MPERTDTRRPLFPEGTYNFTLSDKVEKRLTKSNNKPFYIWPFTTVVKDEVKDYSQILMSWMAAEMLRAFGAKETEKDVFEWEKDQFIGKAVKATIVHSEDNNGVMRANMTNIEPITVDEVPF